MAKCMIMRRGGGAAGGLPNFTYTGAYTLIDDGDKNWRIKFLTSGTFTPEKDVTMDVFVVGGGGGTTTSGQHSSGAGGGYTGTWSGIVAQAGVEYAIVIGAGGVNTGGAGGTSSAFGNSKAGGYPGRAGTSVQKGGDGGSGGGGSPTSGVGGGSDGSNGVGANPGIGQGATTKEFGEASGDLYAAGGGAYGSYGGAGGGGDGRNVTSLQHDGVPNTGGGAGANASTGGSGIVVIRNRRAA